MLTPDEKRSDVDALVTYQDRDALSAFFEVPRIDDHDHDFRDLERASW